MNALEGFPKVDQARHLTSQPDPSLARLEKLFFPEGLTLEDRVRMAVRAAKLEIEPKYVEVLRQLPPSLKVSQAFELWDWARDALYGQGLRRGLLPEEAMQDAARRLLATKNDA